MTLLFLGNAECWDFKYSKENKLGFLLVNSHHRNNSFFYFNELLYFKEFGKKLEKLSKSDGNIIKIDKQSDTLYLKTLRNEITVYRSLRNFENSRQALKYSEIPIDNIHYYYPFSLPSPLPKLYKDGGQQGRKSRRSKKSLCNYILLLSVSGELLWLKLNSIDYEVVHKYSIELERGEVCRASDFSKLDSLLVVSTSRGQRNHLSRLLIHKVKKILPDDPENSEPDDLQRQGLRSSPRSPFDVNSPENRRLLGLEASPNLKNKGGPRYVVESLHKFRFSDYAVSREIFSYFGSISVQIRIGDYPIIFGHQWDSQHYLFAFLFDGEDLVELTKPAGYHQDVVHRLESNLAHPTVNFRGDDQIWSIDWEGCIKRLEVVIGKKRKTRDFVVGAEVWRFPDSTEKKDFVDLSGEHVGEFRVIE